MLLEYEGDVCAVHTRPIDRFQFLKLLRDALQNAWRDYPEPL